MVQCPVSCRPGMPLAVRLHAHAIHAASGSARRPQRASSASRRVQQHAGASCRGGHRLQYPWSPSRSPCPYASRRGLTEFMKGGVLRGARPLAALRTLDRECAVHLADGGLHVAQEPAP